MPSFIASVGGLEADPPNVPGQPIGILGHYLYGIGAIGLVDSDRPRSTDPVLVQEDHDLADDLLLGPGVRHAPGAHRTNPRHLAQPIRLGLDHVENLVAKRADQLLGVDRADPPDHAGAEIFFDAVYRSRRRGLQKPRLELLAMGPVVNPLTGCGDPLAGGNRRRVADDRHQVAVSTGLRPEDAEAVLGIVEGDALDEAGKDFLGR